MISSYRLGDLVVLSLNEEEKNEILLQYPDSIGSKYIRMKKDSDNNIDIITKIVLEHIEENIDLLPKDIDDSTLIHLRLGDVVRGNEWHEKMKRPVHPTYLQKIIPKNNDKIYVIGKCFFAKTSSTNYDECISASNKYLDNVLNTFNAEYIDTGNADIDLCCAVKAKVFIQGRGHFSKLILEIRKKMNLKCIETSCTD
uniref:Uncharacterized protein n=1 Tax=viral metagenome TaxID=1070528 RepID=A0A6C0JL06_9ZZZZ